MCRSAAGRRSCRRRPTQRLPAATAASPERTATATIAVRKTRSTLPTPIQRLDQFTEAECQSHRYQRGYIGAGIERVFRRGGPHRFFWNGLAGNGVAGDDVDADIAGAAHQIMDYRAVQNLEPARPRRLADDDLRHVVGLRIADDVIGDVPIAGGKRNGFAAERFGQPQACRQCGRAPPLTAVGCAGPRHRAPPMGHAGDRRAAWRSGQGRRSAGRR